MQNSDVVEIVAIFSVDKDVEKLDPSYIAGGCVKWYSHFGKQFGSSSNSKT